MAQVVRPRTITVAQTPGETALLNFLRCELDDDWTVYVQPFLNGDEPDLVALNPRAGVIVFEVKDYAEGPYSADDGGWRINDAQGTHRIASPVDQVNRYRNNIIGLYCAEIGEAVDRDQRNLATIRLVLYFHSMTGDTARDMCRRAHQNLIVLGTNELRDGALREKCREVRTGESRIMSPQWAESLSAWLNPPMHLEEHGRRDLTPEQRRHAQPADGRRRLRGVAGSGKSLVLAHRAAARAARGERVLVLTFNITLANYVRDLLRRATSYPHDMAIITHFHEFCRLALDKANCPIPQHPIPQEYFETVLPDAVLGAVTDRVPESLRFDGIYIDEGQDFRRNWFELCTRFLCAENAEMLLVVDYAQNLYERESNWTDDMRGLGFRGPWGRLSQSHRLPRRVREAAWEFARANRLDTEQLLAPEGQQELFNPDLVWHDERDVENACRTVLRLYRHLLIDRQVHPQDIAILVPTHAIGEVLVEYLRNRGEQPNHVFQSQEGNHRRNKKTFWMGSRGVKMCTVHSFKGWESRFVVALLADNTFQNVGAERLFYVALTRCREGIFFVNTTARIQRGATAWDALPHMDCNAYADFRLTPIREGEEEARGPD
jgi:Nuclease-related domain